MFRKHLCLSKYSIIKDSPYIRWCFMQLLLYGILVKISFQTKEDGGDKAPTSHLTIYPTEI